MIESARRAFLMCHNASKSDRSYHQRRAKRERERERDEEDKEEPGIDRQDRESQVKRRRGIGTK